MICELIFLFKLDFNEILINNNNNTTNKNNNNKYLHHLIYAV